MENDPFVDDFPIEPSIYSGFSMAMLNNQMINGMSTTHGDLADFSQVKTSDAEASNAADKALENPWENDRKIVV